MMNLPKLQALILNTSFIHKLCMVFYSFWLGFWVLAISTLPYNPIGYALLVIFGYNLVLIFMMDKMRIKEQEQSSSVKPGYKAPGVIYILRREDGILKLGKTIDLQGRIHSHKSNYKSHFNIVCSWIVPDIDRYERLALNLTTKHYYHEDRRHELRQMTEEQLSALF